MSYAIVPSFTPATGTPATHFWCARHDSILPMDTYRQHTLDAHGGSSPCVMGLVAGTTRVDVTPPSVPAQPKDWHEAMGRPYCQTHDIFDCPFHNGR